MSIVSQLCADEGNSVKDGWTRRLRNIVDAKMPDAKKVELVRVVLEDMEKFRFSE